MTPRMPLTSGIKLGPYEIQSQLGAGGMGEVYRAVDTRLGRVVAIKVLPESLANDPERLQRFEHEARLLSALNHPNLLSIFDVGAQNGIHYLVSEFLEGSTLREKIAGGPLPKRRVVDYALQIATGLSAAHDKGIVHRDLKPDNVFVTREERIKILDFGLAKQTRAAAVMADGVTLTSPTPTAAGIVLGTVGYMSPEQVRGQAVDHRSDVFSFGAILYEMISGKRAFVGDSSIETMNAILKAEPPELAESDAQVSPGLDRIVRRCLEKAPERRFQSASDLAFALESVAGSSTALQTAAFPGKIRHYRWIALAATAFAMALAAGILIGSRFTHKAAPPTHFTRVSFRPGTIFSARFAPDGETILYTGALDGQPPDLYTVQADYPDSRSAGIQGAILLAVSRQGQMALLLRANHLAHFTWEGTLAVAHLGSTAPRELAEHVTSADWAPDGESLAVIRHVGGQYRLEYPVGKVQYESANWIDDARVSPDGRSVAFLLHPPGADDRGDVAIIDSSGSLRILSSGWEGEEGLAWAPSGNEVWFSASALNEGIQYAVYAVTLRGAERMVAAHAGGMVIHDIAPSGRALVASDDGKGRMELFWQGAPARNVSWLDLSWGPVLSRDGAMLALTDESAYAGRDYAVYIRRTDGSAPVRLGRGYVTDIAPDNKWVVSVDLKGGALLLPIGAGENRQLHWDGINITGAGFFPDSRRILLAATEHGSSGRLYVTDISGSQPRPLKGELTSGSGKFALGFSFFAFSPDGQWVAYKANGEWVMQSLESGAVKPIAGIGSDESVVRWTADAKAVFAVREGDNELTIYRVAVDSGAHQLVRTLRPAVQIGLIPLRNGYYGCDVDAAGKTMVLGYGTDEDVLYTAEGLR
ncbi:MAG: protein kinase [Candidatus Sulfotelmatobacter sp.]